MKNKLAGLIAAVGAGSGFSSAIIGLGAHYLLTPLNNPYLNIYEYNANGDIVIKLKLENFKKDKFKNSNAIAIFKNNEGKEFFVKGKIDENGKMSFDTSSLPNNNSYELNRVIADAEIKSVIIRNDELTKQLKTKIVKPTLAHIITDDEKNDHIQVQLDPSTTFKEVVGIFKDENGKKYLIPSKVDQNGTVIFDSSFLPKEHIFELDAIVEKDTKPLKKIANLENVIAKNKKINKFTKFTHDFDNEGNLIVKIPVDKTNLNQEKKLVAIFKDKNGQIYKVNGMVDENNILNINTSQLPNDNNYELTQIVDFKDNNKIVIDSKKIKEKAKEIIVKPAILGTTNDENNNLLFEIKTSKEFEAKKLVATFLDSNNKEINVETFIDKNGKAQFDLSSLPFNDIYKLKNIIMPNPLNKSVVNLKEVNEDLLFVNKLNTFDLNDSKNKITHNKDGDLTIKAKVNPIFKNSNAIAIFKDIDGNEYEVTTNINNEGEILIDTSSLPQDKTYQLDRVTNQNKDKILIKNSEFASNQKASFKKPSADILVKSSKDTIITLHEEPLKNRNVEVELRNQDGKLVVLKGRIDENGKLRLRTSDDFKLPRLNVYTIENIKDSVTKEKLVNLSNLTKEEKIINKVSENNDPKFKDQNTIFYTDGKGNVVIDIENVQNNNENNIVIAIFNDNKGNKHKVVSEIDENGLISIHTKDLPNNNQYTLEKIVSENENSIVMANEELSKIAKKIIYKPAIFTKAEENGDFTLDFKDKDLAGKLILVTFKDSEGNSYEANGIIFQDGIATLTTSDNNIFPIDKIYTLDKIEDKVENSILVNVNDLKNVERKLNKKVNFIHDFTKNGDLVLKTSVDTSKLDSTKEVIAILRDKDGQIHKINSIVDENGKLAIDTSSLPNDNKYTLEKIVNKADENLIVKDNSSLSEEEKEIIIKPTLIELSKEENDFVLNLKTTKELVGKTVEATFVDENNNPFGPIKTIVDENGNVKLDLSSLPNGNLYTLKDLILPGNNPKKIINTDLIPEEKLKINKLNTDELNDPKITTTHNEFGDLILKAKVEKKYNGEQAFGVFKDETGKEYFVTSNIDETGNVIFDTSSLPNDKTYQLDRVVAVNDKEKELVKNIELSSNQKSPFKKPSVTLNVDANKNLSLQTFEETLKNRKVELTFKDQNNKEYKIVGNIDENGNLKTTTSDNGVLPKDKFYTLDSIKDNSTKETLVNLNNVNKNKVVNKIIKKGDSDYQDKTSILGNDVEGNVTIKLNIDPSKINNQNTDGIAIFKDQNNIKHEVPILIDENGKININTQSLPNNNQYNLEEILNSDKTQTLITKEELPQGSDSTIYKPAISAKTNEEGNFVVNFKDKKLANTEVVATFIDETGKEIKLEGTIDENGDVIFNTSDLEKFPENHIYNLDKIVKKDSNNINNNRPLVNLKELNYESLIINKNKQGIKEIDPTTGNETVKISIPNSKNAILSAILKDSNGNKIEVPLTMDQKGNVVIDGSKKPLNTNIIYTIEEIVDKSTNPSRTLIDKNFLNPDAKILNNTKETGRKIIANAFNSYIIDQNTAKVEINFQDLNKLSKNKRIALELVDTTNEKDLHKWITEIDFITNKGIFNFANLTPGKTYKINNLYLTSIEGNKEDDVKIVFDLIKNNTIVMPSEQETLENGRWISLKTISRTTNSAKIAVDIENITSNSVVAKYFEIKSNQTYGEEQSVTLTKEGDQYVADIPNLKANTKYELVKIISNINTPNEKTLLKTKENNDKYFGTDATPIALSFDKNNKNDNVITDTNAKLAISYIDNDNKLEIGNPIILKYREKSSLKLQEIKGYVSKGNKIEFNLSNLKSGKEYVLVELNSIKPNWGSNVNYIFDKLPSSQDSFRTFSEETINQIIWAHPNQKTPYDFGNNSPDIKINASFGREDETFNNKHVKLVYVDNEGNQVSTDVLQFPLSQSEILTFTIDQSKLKGNHSYTFFKAYYGDNENDQPNEISASKKLYSKFFTYGTLPISIMTNAWPVIIHKDANTDLETLKLAINDVDDLLIPNQDKAKIYLATSSILNDENAINQIKPLEAIVIQEQNQKYLKLDLSSKFNINEQYKIYKIEISPRPNKAALAVANDENGNKNISDKIYDHKINSNISLEFNRKFVISNLVIAKTEATDNGNASANLSFTFESLANNNLTLKNKFFKVKLIENDNKEEIISSSQQLSSNPLTFNLENLSSNRQYTIEGLYYGNDVDFENLTEENKVIYKENQTFNKNFVLNPSATNATLENNVQAEIEEAVLTLNLTSKDNIFKTGQEILAKVIRKDNSQVVDNFSGRIIQIDDKFVVSFSFNNLEANTEYKISELKFKEKPEQAYAEINTNGLFKLPNEISWTTKAGKIQLNSVNAIPNSNNKTISIDVNLNLLGRNLIGKKMKLGYILKNPNGATNNPIYTSPVLLKANKNNYVLQINSNSNVEIDKIYILDQVLYGEDNNINNNVNKGSVVDDFVLWSKPINFRFKDASQHTIRSNSMTLKLDFEDLNDPKILDNNSNVKIKYRIKRTDRIENSWSESILSINSATREATLNLNSIADDSYYEFSSIKMDKPNNKDYATQLNLERYTQEFKTIKERKNLIVEKTTNFRLMNSATRNKKAEYSVEYNIQFDNNNSLNNQTIYAVYESNEGIEYKSDGVTLSINPNEINKNINFTLRNLVNNRKYKFKGIQYNNGSSWINNTKNIKDEFITDPGQINIERWEFRNLKHKTNDITSTSPDYYTGPNSKKEWYPNSGTLILTLDDHDDNLKNAQKIMMEFRKSNSNSLEYAEGYVLIEESGTKKAIFNILNIGDSSPEQHGIEYIVEKIRINKIDNPIFSYNMLNTTKDGILYNRNDNTNYPFYHMFKTNKIFTNEEGIWFKTAEISKTQTNDLILNVISWVYYAQNFNYLSQNANLVFEIISNDGTFIYKKKRNKPPTNDVNASKDYNFKFEGLPNRSYKLLNVYVEEPSKNNNILINEDDFMKEIYKDNSIIEKLPVKYSDVPSKWYTTEKTNTSIVRNGNYNITNNEVFTNINSNKVDIKLFLKDIFNNATHEEFVKKTYNKSQPIKVILEPLNNSKAQSKEVIAFLKENENVPNYSNAQEIIDSYWKLEFQVTNLEKNTEYRISKIYFDPKPAYAAVNLNGSAENVIYEFTQNQEEFKFTTLSEPVILQAIDLNQEIDHLNKTASVKIVLNRNGNVLTNKKGKLTYKDSQGRIKEAYTTFVDSDEQIFNFTNLENNEIYGISKIEYANSEQDFASNTNVISIDLEGKFHSFHINPKQVKVKDDFKILTILNDNKVRLKINLTDENNVLEIGQKAKITFGQKDNANNSEIQDIVEIDQNGNKYIIFDAPFIDRNVDYQIKKVEFIRKPDDAVGPIGIDNSNVIYDASKNNSNQFIVSLQVSLKISNLENLSQESNYKINTLKVKVQLEKTGNLSLANKYWKAKFKDNNNNIFWSEIASSSQMKNNSLTFDIVSQNELIYQNRSFTLEGLYYKDGTNKAVEQGTLVECKDNVNKTFIVPSNKTWINKFIYNEFGIDAAKVQVEISSLDAPFVANESELTFKFIKKDQPNSNPFIFTKRVSENNEKIQKFELDFSNLNTPLEPNTIYELIEVKLNAKSSQTIANINSTNNENNDQNIIYSKNLNNFSKNKAANISSLEFQTKSKPAIADDSKIVWVEKDNSNYYERRGSGYLDLAYNMIAEWRGITLDPELGYDFEIEFEGNAKTQEPNFNTLEKPIPKALPKHTNVPVKILGYDFATKTLEFELSKLKAGYEYKITSFKIKQNKTTKNYNKQDQIVYSYIVNNQNGNSTITNTGLESVKNSSKMVAEGYGWDSLSFDRSKSKVPNFNAYYSLYTPPGKELEKTKITIAWNEGWEVSDFGKFFNYLKNEVPITEATYSFNNKKVTLKEKWILEFKQQLIGFLFPLQNGQPYNVYNKVKLIQLGTKLDNSGEDIPVNFANRGGSLLDEANPVLGGFHWQEYTVRKYGTLVNPPYSDSILDESSNFRNLDSILEAVDYNISKTGAFLPKFRTFEKK